MPPDMPDTEDLPALHVVFGASRDPDGWRLPVLAPTHASTSASLHLGPIHVVFEAAAMESAVIALGTEAIQVEDWDVHFMAPGKRGPFLAQAEAMSGCGERVLVRLTLIDEGAEGAPIAAGVAVFGRDQTV
jgi:hypothetical protein